MVPAAFVKLDALPLSPNGKVDRKQLPAPTFTPSTDRDEVPYDPPATPDELLAASIWADVLGIDRVGCRDDFFALGGHSLLATQVVARLRGSDDVDLPVRALFEAPTLTAFAKRIAADRLEQTLQTESLEIDNEERGGDESSSAPSDAPLAGTAAGRPWPDRTADVLAAAAVVSRPARSGTRRVQHPRCAAVARRPRRRVVGTFAGQHCQATRGATHDVRRRGG